MPALMRENSELVLIDFQPRLMAAIHEGEAVIRNASHLLAAARRLDVPRIMTEQNPARLGGTVEALAPQDAEISYAKQSFDAGADPQIAARLDGDAAVVVAGCEAHVCVLQTVLGLLEDGRRVHVVADAIGSRDPKSHAAAIERMRHHGADIVTTEMVIFEWLRSAENPAFKELVALIK